MAFLLGGVMVLILIASSVSWMVRQSTSTAVVATTSGTTPLQLELHKWMWVAHDGYLGTIIEHSICTSGLL